MCDERKQEGATFSLSRVIFSLPLIKIMKFVFELIHKISKILATYIKVSPIAFKLQPFEQCMVLKFLFQFTLLPKAGI